MLRIRLKPQTIMQTFMILQSDYHFTSRYLNLVPSWQARQRGNCHSNSRPRICGFPNSPCQPSPLPTPRRGSRTLDVQRQRGEIDNNKKTPTHAEQRLSFLFPGGATWIPLRQSNAAGSVYSIPNLVGRRMRDCCAATRSVFQLAVDPGFRGRGASRRCSFRCCWELDLPWWVMGFPGKKEKKRIIKKGCGLQQEQNLTEGGNSYAFPQIGHLSDSTFFEREDETWGKGFDRMCDKANGMRNGFERIIRIRAAT